MIAALTTTVNVKSPYSLDFAAGYRKFWLGMALCYCANDAERDGFWDAADEIHVEAQQQRREHGDYVRSLNHA